jgi:hypothetical protein
MSKANTNTKMASSIRGNEVRIAKAFKKKSASSVSSSVSPRKKAKTAKTHEIVDLITAASNRVSKAEWNTLPKDASVHLDTYLYK